MRNIKKILILIVIIILGIIGLLIGQIIRISNPTHGERIAYYDQPQKALLVIDIQEDFTGATAKPPFPYKDSEKLIETVNTIIEAADRKNVLIVYIRQELNDFWGKLLSKLLAGGVALKGNPGTEIDQRISILSDHIFPKGKSDAFSNAKLEQFLLEHQVNELYLVGLDADGCVHVTAQGALNRGYSVNIITDAIVLQAEKKWEKLLQRYQEEGIRLTSSREFLNPHP